MASAEMTRIMRELEAKYKSAMARAERLRNEAMSLRQTISNLSEYVKETPTPKLRKRGWMWRNGTPKKILTTTSFGYHYRPRYLAKVLQRDEAVVRMALSRLTRMGYFKRAERGLYKRVR